MLNRRTMFKLFGLSSLVPFIKIQEDNNTDGFKEIYDYYNKKVNCEKLFLIDIMLGGETQKWGNLRKNNNVIFSRSVPNDLVPHPKPIFYKTIECFPTFFDNDRFGRSKLVEIMDNIIRCEDIIDPYVYILKPLNNKELIGIKVTTNRQDKIILKNVTSESDKLEVPAKPKDIVIKLNIED